MKTAKKTKEAKKAKTGRAVTVRQINKALDTAANSNGEDAKPLPSTEATGLAMAVLSRISRVGKKENPADAVAEMLDSALRVRRAEAENKGFNDGAYAQRDGHERETVESVMARIYGFGAQKVAFATMAITAHEAEALSSALTKAGYISPHQRQARQAAPAVQGRERGRWQVHRTGNGDLAAHHDE